MRFRVTSNAEATANDLFFVSATVQARAKKLVKHHAMLLTQRVRAHASGRPGPNIITGDYIDSIAPTFSIRGSWLSGGVASQNYRGSGKPAPFWRRLEYGFVGADSLGRVYNQPPYPHYGPAADEQRPVFEAAFRAFVDSAIKPRSKS